jgi:hypothetical protein
LPTSLYRDRLAALLDDLRHHAIHPLARCVIHYDRCTLGRQSLRDSRANPFDAPVTTATLFFVSPLFSLLLRSIIR